ncbi:MAG: hypothetical protein JSS82_01260 [Bacteroidetes bacterium]|nr:hypothetical protein [Bacteroidota bacterium]
MKIYRKQLKSLEELKQEKIRLLQLRAKTEGEDLFALDGILPSLGKSEKKEKPGTVEQEEAGTLENIAGTLSNLLGSDLLKGVLGSAGGVLTGIAGKKLREKILMPVLKEVVLGYAKWKAVELGFSAAKMFVKSRKEKKRKEEGKA